MDDRSTTGASASSAAGAGKGADAAPRADASFEEERVPLSIIIAYSVPMAAISAVFMPFSLYYMKFGIEVLLIAPAAIGTIQLIARAWDAVSDPLVGYWSDRTNTRWGRRRPWIVASAVPMGITYVLVWAPPVALEGGLLIAWLFVAYILYETASTGVLVPYAALGMELSEGHHDRTRLFGWRAVIMSVGTFGGFASLYVLREAADQRFAALALAVLAGFVLTASVVYAAAKVPERPHYRVQGSSSIRRAFADVGRNPHARIFLAVMGIEAFGMAIVPQMVVFVLDDVIQDEYLLYWVLVAYAIPQFGLIPLWVRLSRRFGKKKLWAFGMTMSTIAFTSMVFLSAGAYLLISFALGCLGIGLGIASIMGHSVAADIIDWDEMQTGERKEGSYTAVLNFIRKLGLALSAGVVGFGLQFSGYDVTAEVQSAETQRIILWLAGGIPAVCYGAGLLLFTRFRLDGPEHARIQAEIRVQRERGGIR